MSKLRDNPAKVVPIRALIVAFVLTVIIAGLSMFFDFSLILTLVFLWLGTIANMIAFRVVIIGVDRIIAKQETGEKATIIPNLTIRYAMYIMVVIAAWFVGGWIPLIAAFIGIQISQIAIKLDSFVG